MLVPKKISATKKAIYILIIVTLIGAIGYLIFVNFIAGSIALDKPLTVSIPTLVIPKIDSAFDDAFLSREPYTDLRENVQLPIPIGAMGRTNPFSKIIP